MAERETFEYSASDAVRAPRQDVTRPGRNRPKDEPMNIGISREDVRQAQAEVKKLRTAPHPHELVKIAEAAYICDLNAQTIRRWIREGRIKAYGWKGSLRVRLEELLPEIEITPPASPKGKG